MADGVIAQNFQQLVRKLENIHLCGDLKITILVPFGQKLHLGLHQSRDLVKVCENCLKLKSYSEIKTVNCSILSVNLYKNI